MFLRLVMRRPDSFTSRSILAKIIVKFHGETMKNSKCLIALFTLFISTLCYAKNSVDIIHTVGPLSVIELELNNKKFKFLLDTGSNANFINPNISNELGPVLVRDKNLDTKVNTFAKKSTSKGYLMSFNIEDLSFKNMKTYESKTSKFTKKYDGFNCCDGILGGEFIKHYPLKVNLKDKKVSFLKRPIKSSLKPMDIEVEGFNTYTKKCSYMGQELKIRIDSGNELPLIFQKYATEKLMLKEQLFKAGYNGSGLAFFKVPLLKCGNFEFRNLMSSFFASGSGALSQSVIDINAGAHLLGDEYILDIDKKRIYLSQNPLPFTAKVKTYKLNPKFKTFSGDPSIIDQTLALTASACAQEGNSGECLKLMCTLSNENDLCTFNERGNALYDFITYRFPIKTPDCSPERLLSELRSKPARYNFCWYKLYQLNKPMDKDSLNLPIGVDFKRFEGDIRPFDVLQIKSPMKLTQQYYCFAIYKNLIDYKTLPANLFALSIEGLAYHGHEIKDYKKWLTTSKAKECVEHLSQSLNIRPSQNIKVKNSVLINPFTILGHGVRDFSKNLKRVLNHEFLHLLYASSEKYQKRAQVEWSQLSAEKQNEFKKKHPSYDFTNQKVLLKEYFSYEYQNSLEKL